MKRYLQPVLVLLCVFAVVACADDPDGNDESVGSIRMEVLEVNRIQYRIAPVDVSTWINPAKRTQVENELDRMAQYGINTVLVGSFKFMPMYFVDYSGSAYPEAAQYDVSGVAENLKTINSNIEFAHTRGIRVLSGSYSHYCPYAFWTAHQDKLNPDGIFTDEWLLGVHQSDVFQDALKGKDDGVVPHQQWNNACFKDFFVWSTERMLDLMPALDGFLNCYAESAWTYDMAKLKSGVSEGNGRDLEATNRDFIDYMNTIYDILVKKRGEDNFEIGIRDWYMDMNLLKQTKIPIGKIIVSIKYAGYDQPLANFPAWGVALKDDGFNVIFDMLIYDAEYPHPVYWYDNDFIHRIFSNIEEAGFIGVSYQDYRAKSKGDESNPIRLMTQQTVASAFGAGVFKRQHALEYLTGIYGAGAPYLLRSLECVTAAQADCIKLTPAWFWTGDGLTVGGLAYNRLWKFGDNANLPSGTMDFVRQDVVGIPEYCDAVIADKKTPGSLDAARQRWKTAGKKTPPEAFAEMERNATEALNTMITARSLSGKGENFGELFASAVIHQQLVLRDLACMRGTVAFLCSGGQIDAANQSTSSKILSTGIDRKNECVDEFRKHIQYDLQLRELCRSFAPRRPSLDDPKGYEYVTKPAAYLGKSLTVPGLDIEERTRLFDLIRNRE